MKAARSAKSRRPAFSVVTMTRNEAKNLPALFEGLRPFLAAGGEVIVLDTGSDDGTPALARSLGAKVVEESGSFNSRLTAKQAARIQKAFAVEGEGPIIAPGERLFHFSRARNRVAELSHCDFQLAVDGADVLDEFDWRFVDELVRAKDAPHVARFETRRLHQGTWFIENRDYFLDRRRIAWSGRAHNFLTAIDPAKAVRSVLIPRERLRVSHHTADKARGYQLGGVALDVLEAPDLPERRFLLGRELFLRGFVRSAIQALMAVDRENVPSVLRSAALSMAAGAVSAAGGPGSDDEAMALLFRSARRDSSRRDPWLKLARHASARSDFQAAVSFAEAALAIPTRVVFSEVESNQREGPHEVMYWALFWLGRRDEARTHFKECLRFAPTKEAYRLHADWFV